jgi:hypothetical protein
LGGVGCLVFRPDFYLHSNAAKYTDSKHFTPDFVTNYSANTLDYIANIVYFYPDFVTVIISNTEV